eukprot:TRINITY_DN47253_c0_g1_i1.p1 TRINITY_DN47253_c0_g1~~TRINITY_DN47253_c0_g1_i1.p1  ORF type:complete len:1345 (+),score=298.75 TRINITY_DN47253_c0_g1_i1:117-4151(+)
MAASSLPAGGNATTAAAAVVTPSASPQAGTMPATEATSRTATVGEVTGDVRQEAEPAAELSPGRQQAADCNDRRKMSKSSLSSRRSARERHEDRLRELLPQTLPLISAGHEDFYAMISSRSRSLAGYPGLCAFSCIGLVVVAVCAGVATLPLELETNFDSFLKTDVQSSLKRSVFLEALKEKDDSRRLQNATADDESLGGHKSVAVVDLYLAYELEDKTLPDGIFNARSVDEMARFERQLRELPGWKAFCGQTSTARRRLCEPGVSYVNYALASTVKYAPDGFTPEELQPDGQGREAISRFATLKVLHDQELEQLLLPSDTTWTADTDAVASSVTRLRSAFRFEIAGETAQLAHQKWKQFFQDELSSVLRSGTTSLAALASDGEGAPSLLKVYFDGTSFADFEVAEALTGDLTLACGSATFVLLYLLFHTRSFLLSGLGLMLCVLSVPLAYVVTALIVGSTTVSFASFLALFLAVGFGCDVIFVYTDAWRDSVQHTETDADRLAWTMQRAGKASFATTATTALSFFANLASTIRALRQFGFFMGVCVMLVWALISIIYAPLCLFDERCSKGCSLRLRHLPCTRCFEELEGTEEEDRKEKEVLNRAAKQRDRRGHSLRVHAFGYWAQHLCRWRLWYVSLAFLAVVGSLTLTVRDIKPAVATPNLFPEGHNRHRSDAVFQNFEEASKTFPQSFAEPEQLLKFCNQSAVASEQSRDCKMFWCVLKETPMASAYTSTSGNFTTVDCSCFRRTQLCSSHATTWVTTNQHFVNVEDVSTSSEDRDALYSDVRGYFETNNGPAGFGWGYISSSDALSPLLLQDWESGDSRMQPVVRVQSRLKNGGTDSNICEVNDMCFCGGLSCTMPPSLWRPAASVKLRRPRSSSAGDGDAARRLQSTSSEDVKWRFPKAERATIRVVVGLTVDISMTLLGGDFDPSKAWIFTSTFAPHKPWAQRSLYNLCADVPEDMRLERQWCWISEFKNFLHDRREIFPTVSTRFQPLFEDFVESKGNWKKYMWIRNGQLMAYYASFRVDYHWSQTPSAELHAYKSRWDTYLSTWDDHSQSGAFHVSKTWVEAEVQDALIESTVSTLLVLVLLAFVGMLVFTRSVTLSCFVVVATVAVVAGLSFCIVVVLEWSVGLIEVIAIIYFVGYAVTYSLHIAHMYAANHAEDPVGLMPRRDTGEGSRCSFGVKGKAARRFLRVNFSLQAIGGAALGSAATTAGSSAFLVLCTLTVFRKLGLMCLIVTLLSIIVALGPLPAALLAFGPVRPGKFLGTLAKCCTSFLQPVFGPLGPLLLGEESESSYYAESAGDGSSAGGERGGLLFVRKMVKRVDALSHWLAGKRRPSHAVRE